MCLHVCMNCLLDVIEAGIRAMANYRIWYGAFFWLWESVFLIHPIVD